MEMVALPNGDNAEHLVSKLINFMKISQMEKYGLPVFKSQLQHCLACLTDDDLGNFF